MSDTQRPIGGPAAPRPSTPVAAAKRGGVLGRVGQMLGGKSKEPTDPALALRESLSSKLPTTDPLRAARLQTHLFMGQLPSFPTAGDKPLTTPVADSGASVDSASVDSGGGGIAALRAEKQSRDAAKAEAEEIAARDPARQRVESLRQRRQIERRVMERRPASAPTRVAPQSTSKATQAAAARTPARVALSQAATGVSAIIPERANGRNKGGGLNGLLLLLLLVTLALVIAGAFWGYNWYRNQEGTTVVETPSPDVFDDRPSTTDPTIASTVDPIIPAVPTQPVEESGGGVDPFALEESIRQTTVLLLEQELNSQSFMADGRDVDGVYTAATLGALRSFATTTVNPELAQEVLSAGLQPTQEQLEKWQTILDDFL